MEQIATSTAESGCAPPPAILIVDDEPDVRAVVAEFLEDFGYRVLQAEDGTRALARLRDNPGVQLLISDVRMPGMSGIELAELAAVQQPGLRIILMSGYFTGPDVRHRLLHKPFRMKALQEAVRAELEMAG